MDAVPGRRTRASTPALRGVTASHDHNPTPINQTDQNECWSGG
ncbi:MAG: hypothetical protein RL040_899, partial [Bacteroidota bacterium]